MSYEYFLQAHIDQGSQEISTERILSIFREYIVAGGDTYIDLRFDERNSCTIYLDVSEPTVSGFMVSRPCGGKLGDCLYEVMQLGNFVFFEPEGKHMIAARAFSATHLPEDMVETLGEPVLGETRESFLALYSNNR
jgi:hypothetical protein